MYSKKFSEMNTILDNLLEIYRNTVTDGVKVATLEEVKIRYKKDKTSLFQLLLLVVNALR